MRQLLLGTALLFSISITHAQNIETTLAQYAKDYGQEKMYLHFDKSSYAVGETIWFKAYLMKTVIPDDESKTVYIEICVLRCIGIHQ